MKCICNNCLQILFRVFILAQCVRVDGNISVGTANRFVLDDPEIESRWDINKLALTFRAQLLLNVPPAFLLCYLTTLSVAQVL
jgi:hypothetical protein